MKRPRISKFEANLDAIIANAESAQDAPGATAAAQTTDAELEADDDNDDGGNNNDPLDDLRPWSPSPTSTRYY